MASYTKAWQITVSVCAGAFYILFRDEAGDEFTTMWHSFLTCFSFMVSDFDISYFYSVSGSSLIMSNMDRRACQYRKLQAGH